jgi:hypothetical protein
MRNYGCGQAGVGKKIHFATETCHCGLEQVLCVGCRELYGIRDRVQMLNGNFASTIKTIRYPDRMNAAVQESFALFEESSGEDFVIVSLGSWNGSIVRTHQRHQLFRLQSHRPGSWITVRVAWRSDVQPPSD